MTLNKMTAALSRDDFVQIAATACFWAWCYLWTSNAGNADWPIADANGFPFVRLGFWLGNGIGLALFAALVDAKKEISSTPILIGAALVQAIGSAAVVMLRGSDETTLLAVAAFTAGCSCVCYLPGWRKIVAMMSARESVMFVGASACLALALLYAILLLPSAAAMIAFLLLPLAGGALALLDSRKEAHRYTVSAGKAHTGKAQHAFAFKWLYIVLTMLVLAVMGLDTLAYDPPLPRTGPDPSLVGGLVLSAAFLALFVFGQRERDIAKYLVVPYMPLAIALVFLGPFFLADAGTLLQMAISLDFACWCFLLAIGIDSAVQTTRSRIIHGLVLGICPILAYAVQSFFGAVDGFDAALSAATYIIVFATAVLVTFRIAFTAQKAVTDDDNMAAAAKLIAAEEGLSPRETEVFMLLAYGHGQSYIQKQLYIAPGTVKTHVKHIYTKLNINSREELIEQVRKAARQMF